MNWMRTWVIHKLGPQVPELSDDQLWEAFSRIAVVALIGMVFGVIIGSFTMLLVLHPST